MHGNTCMNINDIILRIKHYVPFSAFINENLSKIVLEKFLFTYKVLDLSHSSTMFNLNPSFSISVFDERTASKGIH